MMGWRLSFMHLNVMVKRSHPSLPWQWYPCTRLPPNAHLFVLECWRSGMRAGFAEKSHQLQDFSYSRLGDFLIAFLTFLLPVCGLIDEAKVQ